MIAKKTAASLIGQFRATNPPRLTRIDELPDQDLVDRPVPIRRADDLLDDDAVPLDHEALRHPRGLVESLDGTGAVVQDVEAEAELPRELQHGGAVRLVDADRHDGKVVPGELAMQPLHGRHLDATRLAPGGPDVDQDDLAAVVGERGRAPRAQVDRSELGGSGPDRHEVELRPDLDHQRHAEHEPHHRADRDRPGPRRGHTVARHWRRSSRTSRAGSELVKIALPATKVSAPAACAATIVWGVIPPSTSSTARLRCAESSSRARRILPVEDGRQPW